MRNGSQIFDFLIFHFDFELIDFFDMNSLHCFV